MTHWLSQVPQPLQQTAVWLSAHEPHGVPKAVYAALVVAGGWAAGRFGSRIIASLVQVALLAASVVVAWDLLRI
jgi:hypothetical protein